MTKQPNYREQAMQKAAADRRAKLRRDYATAAMQIVMRKVYVDPVNLKEYAANVARISFAVADAMLAEDGN